MPSGVLVILERCLVRQFVFTASRVSINTEPPNRSNRDLRQSPRFTGSLPVPTQPWITLLMLHREDQTP
jgi:hypothetical protein